MSSSHLLNKMTEELQLIQMLFLIQQMHESQVRDLASGLHDIDGRGNASLVT